VLDADRPDLELAFIQDDAVVLMSLGMDDLSQIQVIPHYPADVASF